MKLLAYKITNVKSGKAYVGVTRRGLKKRWIDHLSHARTSSTPLHRALRKYGVNAFTVEEFAHALDPMALDDLEHQLIQQECTHVSQGGYNVTFGGEGTVGWVPSLQTRARLAETSRQTMTDPQRRAHLSICARKQWQDPEIRRRTQNAMKGKVISLDQRAKLSRASKGHLVSEETRELLRQQFRGRPRPPEVAAKMRVAFQGRKHTAESRAKMSAASRGKPKSEAWKAAARRAWEKRRAA